MRDKILVVDDEVAIRELLHEVFISEGYSVRTVTNGREALDVLESEKQGWILLLDLMMPVLDGFAVLDTLEKNPDLRDNNAIVVMSALKQPGVLDTTHLVNAFIPKPFDIDQLMSTVARLMNLHEKRQTS